MRAYRLVAARHRDTALTGEGARRHGGRWNPVGTPVVYVAETLSLAVLELRVHLHIEEARKRYVALTLEWPDTVASGHLMPEQLPPNWRAGEIPRATRQLGRRRLAPVCALRVPSVVLPQEYNWVLNPVHADFARVQVVAAQEPFFLDERLFG